MTAARPLPAAAVPPVLRPARAALGGLDLAVLAAALLPAAIGLWLGSTGTAPLFRVDAVAVAVALAQSVPLLWRRRHPVAVFAVVVGAALGHAWMGHPASGGYLGPVFATYALAAYASALPAAIGLTALLGGFALTGGWMSVSPGRGGPTRLSELVTSSLLAALVWGVGRYVQVRRAYLSGLVARAERAEADAAEATRRALADERARIARELHDVVAHHVGVMVLQAGGARGVLERDPTRARMALEQIERSGREALTAMPVLLDALRDGRSNADGTHTADGASRAGSTAPIPSLDHLPELLRSVEAAGLTVTLRTDGASVGVPDGVGLAAYRVVQESLTNVLRHARARSAAVALTHGRDGLVVTITDDGIGRRGSEGDLRRGRVRRDPPGAQTRDASSAHGSGAGVGQPAPARAADPGAASIPSGGHGIAGMRERVALLGGRLSAGPGEGGWSVRAEIPWERGR